MNLEQILFIDIETVPEYEFHKDLPADFQKLWNRKAKSFINETTTAEHAYEDRAGIFGEFGKIICIGTGFFMKDNNGKLQFKQKTIYGTNEKELLEEFLDICNKYITVRKDINFAGHNIKEFDIPYICRRLLINHIGLPKYLDFQNLKPWETNLIDTLHWWRFGDYKNYTSLDLIATVLGLPTSKDEMDGSMVSTVYYKEKDLPKIANYCSKDVALVALVYLRYTNQPTLEPSDFIL